MIKGIDIAGKTDPGCVRERNEDSLAIDLDLGLMVVADGMGGHNSGEVASSLATGTIMEFARQMLGGSAPVVPVDDTGQLSVRGRQLLHCVRGANTAIFEKSKAGAKDHGMGTTVVAAIADTRTITIAHVGDSRMYLLRGGALQRMTEDHSLVMDQVKHGLITAEEAEKSHLQNILTRALGTEETVQVDVEDHPVMPQDVYLLCTDGLTKMVPENDISRVLVEREKPVDAVDELIRMARAAGGTDNITVLIARVIAGPRGKMMEFFTRLFGK